MRVFWSANSIKDLESIHAYISKDSLYYADRQIEKILNCENELTNFPFSGRIVPEYSDTSIKELIVDNYRIIYRIEEDRISVLTVFRNVST
ncbi:type II toxin-antitoxin system RelE/ParE family toxin [Oceanispirochaeta crateris]|uniref:Type II toxin-antitoxin system RelE/ParE family toxin n=1 Tax=Oceanispirochaeta crateris TaxID=2518645 RepID=A0A5C1QMV2_9SPIO|nr:type II toxin-antitoxin system RelE/ParE family toxin [Oceanispirochaeta crateris]